MASHSEGTELHQQSNADSDFVTRRQLIELLAVDTSEEFQIGQEAGIEREWTGDHTMRYFDMVENFTKLDYAERERSQKYTLISLILFLVVVAVLICLGFKDLVFKDLIPIFSVAAGAYYFGKNRAQPPG